MFETSQHFKTPTVSMKMAECKRDTLGKVFMPPQQHSFFVFNILFILVEFLAFANLLNPSHLGFGQRNTVFVKVLILTRIKLQQQL